MARPLLPPLSPLPWLRLLRCISTVINTRRCLLPDVLAPGHATVHAFFVAATAQPLLAGDWVAVPAWLLAAARAGRAALQAPPLRHFSAHICQLSRLRRAPLQHAVRRQLAAMAVCILPAGITQPLGCGGVVPPVTRGVVAATVRAAPLLADCLRVLAFHRWSGAAAAAAAVPERRTRSGSAVKRRALLSCMLASGAWQPTRRLQPPPTRPLATHLLGPSHTAGARGLSKAAAVTRSQAQRVSQQLICTTSANRSIHSHPRNIFTPASLLI